MANEVSGNSQAHYRDLDGVRGILAFVTMLYHYGIETLVAKATHGAVVSSPWGAVVDFFFILSGFVLTRAYLSRPRSFAQVFVERVFRLMPVHLFVLALFAPLYLVTLSTSPQEILAEITATSVYFSLPRWNKPDWSMNIELYLPVILLGLVMAIRKFSLAAVIVMLIALLCVDSYLAYRLSFHEVNYFFRGVVGLTCGALLYKLTQVYGLPQIGTRWLLPVMCVGLLGWICVSGRYQLMAFASPLLMMAMIWLGARSDSLLGRGPIAYLGTLSYTIYLVHWNLKALVLYLMHVDSFNGSFSVKLVLIPTVVAFAALVTHFVELPAMRWGKRLSRSLARAEG